MLITALIQSSSATTVMVVSFVNAGLLTLAESISVIMGANIGTTVTAWIISIFGFKVDMAAFALPLLAIALPLIFSGKSNRKSIGEFIFGFLSFFMGLSYLKANAPRPECQSGNACLRTGLHGYGILFHYSVLAHRYNIDHDCASLCSYHGNHINYVCQRLDQPGTGSSTRIGRKHRNDYHDANLAALTANTQAKRAALAILFLTCLGSFGY